MPLKAPTKQLSFQSVSSRRSKVPEFRHTHKTYMTCFGCLHIATCIIGFFSLLGVCFSLIYCVILSQDTQAKSNPNSNKTNYKLASVPMIATIITILYLFIGIVQQRAKLLYPFIVLQIASTFGIAIMLVMTLICVACETRYILDAFLGKLPDKQEYSESISLLIALLCVQFCLQLWSTRAVCTCYRYFTDLKRFEIRSAQYISSKYIT